jgi:hypothetical protein
VSERLIAELAEVERALLRLSGSWAGVSAAYLTTAAGAAWLQEMSAAADVLRSRLGPGPLPAMRASAPPEASGLRETCDALATEWENEALRRDRDAAAEKAASKRDRLILGASFERNHADRLRAALAATPDARPDPRDAVIEAARGLMEIVDGSRGVEGWHLNGDVATWDEFEQPEALRSALAALPASPQATTPAPSHDAKE